uniref:Small integral membrane protein 14 n=1 Tax=Ceratitis capitata TaxID=7213 RepID=W8BET7_CERCA
MADEFDGCECVWSHEYAMQRLLAMIRQNQNHCTDTECIDISGRVREANPTGGEEGNFTMMTMLMIFAVLMYLIRPESILKLTNTKRRSRRQDPNDDMPPPPPPPAPPAVN